jgi:hypothetical protein
MQHFATIIIILQQSKGNSLMASPIRLKDSIIREAEAEAALFSRSVPKQIEFWAEIGRRISHSVTPNELMALLNGIAEIRIDIIDTQPIDATQIFAAVERKNKNGSLAKAMTQTSLYYEASKSNPGLLDCVQEDGSRTSGYFRNGKFEQK